MAIKLLCPECLSDNIEVHFTPKQATEKFKCLSCGVVRSINKMQYETIHGESDERKIKGKLSV